MKKFERSISYILCALTALGFAGLHRFYLKKPATGILWLCTWGLFGIGTIYDLVNMEKLVERAEEDEYFRERERRGELMTGESDRRAFRESRQPYVEPGTGEGLDDLIARLAEDSGGIVTAANLAREGDMNREKASELLERLVISGVAERYRLPDGTSGYRFGTFWAKADGSANG